MHLAHRRVSAYIQSMNTRPLIRRYCPTMEDLAAEAGLSHDYVKHLAKEKNPRNAGEAARVRLAHAFKKQAARLLEDAAALEQGILLP